MPPEIRVIVCHWCKRPLRRCSDRCMMGGWVHTGEERHLCNPAHAMILSSRISLRPQWLARPEILVV